MLSASAPASLPQVRARSKTSSRPVDHAMYEDKHARSDHRTARLPTQRGRPPHDRPSRRRCSGAAALRSRPKLARKPKGDRSMTGNDLQTDRARRRRKDSPLRRPDENIERANHSALSHRPESPRRPCRLDFSRADSLLITVRGGATSMSLRFVTSAVPLWSRPLSGCLCRCAALKPYQRPPAGHRPR